MLRLGSLLTTNSLVFAWSNDERNTKLNSRLPNSHYTFASIDYYWLDLPGFSHRLHVFMGAIASTPFTTYNIYAPFIDPLIRHTNPKPNPSRGAWLADKSSHFSRIRWIHIVGWLLLLWLMLGKHRAHTTNTPCLYMVYSVVWASINALTRTQDAQAQLATHFGARCWRGLFNGVQTVVELCTPQKALLLRTTILRLSMRS